MALLRPTRKSVGVVLGGLALGVAGNALWEVAVRPVGTILVRFATLGSAKFRDSIYADAATDPTAVPQLFMLAIVGAIYLAPGFALLRKMRREPESEEERKRRKAPPRWVVYGSLVAAMTFILLQVVRLNAAVLVWREFHANIAILSPRLSSQDIADLRSRFACMKTRDEYRALDADLQSRADREQLPHVHF